MNRFNNINALLSRLDTLLPKIESEYNSALQIQTISSDLKINIKDFVSHLRSILDYLAHDIRDTYCPTADSTANLYFPIRNDKVNFDQYINGAYPGLPTNHITLYNYLESLQAYNGNDNEWLTLFNKLNNENKHEKLVEQKRTETRSVKVSNKQGRGSVSWSSGVKFGSGIKVMGVPIDPNTQMPIPNKTTTTEVTIWVDFKFIDINVSALWLLKESLKRIKDIVTEVKKYL